MDCRNLLRDTNNELCKKNNEMGHWLILMKDYYM